MGFKTFKCVICEEEVTKPKSFAFGGGRACRIHQEVVDFVEKQKAEQKAKLETENNKRSWAETEWFLTKITVVSQYRVLKYMYGEKIATYNRLTQIMNLPHEKQMEIRQECIDQGDMTDDEFGSSLLSALHLKDANWIDKNESL